MTVAPRLPLLRFGAVAVGLLIVLCALLFRFAAARSVLTVLDANLPWCLLAGVLVWLAAGAGFPSAAPVRFRHTPPGWAVLFFLVSAILLSTPFVVWLGGRVYYNTFGGLLPWHDAVQYLKGAMRLTEFGTLTEWTQRRPLTGAWLSVLDMLAGSDLRLLLLFQLGLLAVACSVATLAVARHLGVIEGGVFFLVFMALARPFTPIVNSESLGMFWAFLAFAALVYAAYQRRLAFLAAGMLLLTLSMRARSGLVTLDPLLLLWAGWWFRHTGRRWSWLAVGTALCGIAVAVGIDMLTGYLYGDLRSLFTGNSAYVFYGLARGGTGWQTALHDFPQLSQMDELSRLAFVQHKAWEQFIAHPFVLFGALAKNAVIQPAELWFYMLDGVGLVHYGPQFHDQLMFRHGTWPALSLWVRIAGAAVLMGGGLWRGVHLFWHHRATLEPLSWLSIFGLVGTLASVPIVFQDVQSLRILAPAFPWLALAITVAVIGLKHHWKPRPWQGGLTDGSILRLTSAAVALGIAVSVFAVCGPAVAHWHRQSWARPAPLADCPAGAEPMQLFLGPRTPWLWVDDKLPRGAGFSPHIAPDRLSWLNYLTGRNELVALPSSGALIFGVDRLSKNLVWLFAPTRIVPPQRGYVNLCARTDKDATELVWGRLSVFVEPGSSVKP